MSRQIQTDKQFLNQVQINIPMKIEKIINAVAQENTYLLSNSAFSLIIDPGSNPSALTEKISADKPVSNILLTHAHFDHIMGLQALLDTFPEAQIYLHESEKEWMQNPELNASLLLTGRPVIAPSADKFYQLGKTYKLDGFRFRVLPTPGHSIGGVSLVFDDENIVFTGDALFKNAVGRWDLPTGNYEQLITSVREQLFTLPDTMKVYAGHGLSTTIGNEKRHNPFFSTH